jgi:hypothetical protein
MLALDVPEASDKMIADSTLRISITRFLLDGLAGPRS